MRREFEIKSNGKTVLLVESDDCVRILVREYLEANGFEVKDAATAEEAIRLAGAWGGNRPDILVTEVHLPDSSGSWLAGILRRRAGRSLAVVYLVWDDLNMETLYGDDRHLQKPFSFVQLHSALEEACASVEPDAPKPWPLSWVPATR